MQTHSSFKVVIVDDAPFVREALEEILVRAGHQVVAHAENGEQAISECLKHKPELVIMDIVMPLKSGVQATKEILEQLPATKIVACSTVDQEIMIMKVLEAGAHDFITKPFQVNDVLERINKVMSST